MAVFCAHCLHYYVTWDPQRPYGCKAMGFKSRYMPSLEVRRSSGQECRLFTPNPRRKAVEESKT